MRTTRGGLFVLVPVVGVIALLGDEVVRLLLQRGAFDPEAARLTAGVMKAYAPAMLLAFVVNNFLTGIFADPGAPRMRLIGVSVAAALVCKVVFILLTIGRMGVAAIALASSVASVGLMSVLYPMLRARWGRFLRRSDLRSLVGVALSCAGALLLVHELRERFWAQAGAGVPARVGLLLALAAAGGICYLALAALLRVREISAARDVILKRRR